MVQSVTKKRFLLWHTVIMVASGLAVYGVIQLAFPKHYFVFYPAIPLFFYLFGWYYIYTFDSSRRYDSKKILSVYIGMKVVKMLLSMLILLFYVLFVHVHRSDFIIVFFLFYLFSLLYETFFFYHFERNKLKKEE